MQKIFVVLVLMLGFTAGLRIYDNMSSPEPLQEAYALACDVLDACPDDEPVVEDVGPFEHHFVFDTADGILEVRCRWENWIAGAVECEARAERNVKVRTNKRYPHELERGL